jgi:ABC-2 type transport system permease protein
MSRLGREAVAFGAAARKEWLVLWRYPVNIVVTLATAVLLPAAYVAQANGFAGHSQQAIDAFANRAGTLQLAGFIYLGWAVFLWISMMLWGPGMTLREQQMQGSLEAAFLTPVSRFTLLFGPATAHLVPALMVFGVVGLMLRFVFGVPIGWGNLLGGLLVVAASVPMLFALGAIFAVSVLRFQDAQGISAAVQGLVTVLCGITYPVAVLPGWIQPVSEALPPTQVLTALRTAVLQPSGFDGTLRRAAVLLAAGAVIGVAAILILGRAVRGAQQTGRLGQF